MTFLIGYILPFIIMSYLGISSDATLTEKSGAIISGFSRSCIVTLTMLIPSIVTYLIARIPLLFIKSSSLRFEYTSIYK